MDGPADVLTHSLFARTEDFVNGVLDTLRARPSYAHLPADKVRSAVRQHVVNLIDHFREGGKPLTRADEDFFRSVGEQRALQGITVEDLVHVWRTLIDLVRAHVAEAVDVLVEHPDVLLRLLRTTDQLDKGLLAMVSGYQRVQSSVVRTERERRGDLVRRFMTPGTEADELRKTADAHGLDVTSTFQPFRARPADDRELARLESLVSPPGRPTSVLHGLVDGDLCGITSRPLTAACEYTIGVADAVPLLDLPEAFRLATRALTAATRMRRPGLCHVADLGLHPAVLSDDDVGAAMHARYIAPQQAQGPSGESVLDTVEAYLEHNTKLAPTARALHVHLNTVRYRIARFEESAGVSLRDTARLAEVWWALRRRRLISG